MAPSPTPHPQRVTTRSRSASADRPAERVKGVKQLITVTLMQPGTDSRTVQIQPETSVETFLGEQNLAGTVYLDTVEAGPEDILMDGARILVIPNKSVKGG